MTFHIKIVGAGSIGNHLAHAARRLDWSVDICDLDSAALQRTRDEIYPGRYGHWDETIRLFSVDDAPKGEYDLICIGTPPDAHITPAIAAISESPRAILVEKPFCKPDLVGAQDVYECAQENGVKVFTGYDHVVGEASVAFVEALLNNGDNELQTLDVEFREYWGGIFVAHPWLDGPADSYLGYWRRGGGASGEHSHAINLWQHFALAAGAGDVVEVQATMSFVNDGTVDYDKLCLLNLKTANGLTGRVIQDVVTSPPRKWARAQGVSNYIEWQCGFEPGIDSISFGDKNGEQGSQRFKKNRPDDFIRELQHIEAALMTNQEESPISIEHGLDTMLVIAAAHKSAREGRTVHINRTTNYTPQSLI